MDSTPASLLERLRQPGERQAWDRFVDLYTPLIYSWTCRMGLQANDAADLVQEVFIVLWHKMAEFRYDPQRSFRAWLRTVMVNKAHDLRRRREAALRGGSVSLQDFTIANGLASDGQGGGGILDNAASLTLSHISFNNNEATNGNGGPEASGGAVFDPNGSLDVENSTFRGNHAIGGHGGDACGGCTLLTGLRFSECVRAAFGLPRQPPCFWCVSHWRGE
jgi:hypothetical protein